MKDLTGQHIDRLKSDTRLIHTKGDEALVIEKTKGNVSVHICNLEDKSIRSHFSFYNLSQDSLHNFLLGVHQKRPLTKGIRVGPMFRDGQTRRIIVLKKQGKDSHFIKIEALSKDDACWKNNGSGWVPMTNLSHKAPGMVVFIKDIAEGDLVEIEERYTKQGIFYLREDLEVYIETVKIRYAFGKLVPREDY
jgi:hypothetical protein